MAVRNKIFKASNLKKTVNYIKKNGVRHAFYAAKERIEEERRADYCYRKPSAELLEAQRRDSAAYPELFSIVVPAYETKEEFLREMMESVRRQSYPKWELIIADASSSDIVRNVVEEVIGRSGDCRIKYRRLEENGGISCNTNAAIALAAGDYIALLDHDDFLAPDALYYMAVGLQRARNRGVTPVLLYTDEDKYDNNGSYHLNPHRKKDFNLDLILSNNYICHFMAVEACLLKRLLLREEFDGAQDYDLVLRVIGELYKITPVHKLLHDLPDKIVHIPRILYHWRSHADSTAENTSSKTYAYEAGKAALADFCASRGWQAQVRHGLHLGFYEVDYQPDILTARQEAGIVGGRILDAHGRICGGAMDVDGSCLYEGLHKEYSGGNTHRATLKQDVPAVDIRCMQVREELRREFEHITGLPYEERTIRCGKGRHAARIQIADVTRLVCDEAGYRKLSLELSKAAENLGYFVIWNPRMSVLASRG